MIEFLLEGGENLIANTVQRAGVAVERTKKSKASTFTVDAVLPRGEGDVAPCAGAGFPDAEPNQLESSQRALCEVQLGWRDATRSGHAIRRLRQLDVTPTPRHQRTTSRCMRLRNAA
jgi:hypothetical protein